MKTARKCAPSGQVVMAQAVLDLLCDLKAYWDEQGFGDDAERSDALYARLGKAIGQLSGEEE